MWLYTLLDSALSTDNNILCVVHSLQLSYIDVVFEFCRKINNNTKNNNISSLIVA